MKTIRTKAIVLKRTNYGEADRILHLLTPDGKVSVIAKSVRREKSKMAGGVELFAVSDVVIQQSRSELGILTSARLGHFYQHILEDYDRLQFAYLAIRLVSKASEAMEGSDWFEILNQTLMGLDNLSVRLGITQTWFYLHYSAMLGHELSLWHDVDGKEMSESSSYRYDVAERGLRTATNGDITADHIKLLRVMANKPLASVAQIGGVDEVIDDCVRLTLGHAAIDI